MLFPNYLQHMDPGDMDRRAFEEQFMDQLGTKISLKWPNGETTVAYRFADPVTLRSSTFVPVSCKLFDPDLEGDG